MKSKSNPFTFTTHFSCRHIPILALIVTAVLAAAVGFLGGVFLSAETVAGHNNKPAVRLKIVVLDDKLQEPSQHTVLSSQVWPKTEWGQNCTVAGRPASTGLGLLCRLPAIWKDCSGGIYLDVGTNVGAQLRKLYSPWQFPGALVLDLFTNTYGHDRSKVCALGIEANPTHTAYLTVLNAFFKRKGYQALVLTETAASIRPGQAIFEQDPENEAFQEWGARLATTTHAAVSSTDATVPLFDLPAFILDVVQPIMQQHQWSMGRRLPVGMKIDVEGEEYALLPGLITSGGLCAMEMVYVELHKKSFRTEAGKAVGMLLPAIEKTFQKMRVANPRCTVNYTHVDDETYLHADVEVPLPP